MLISLAPALLASHTRGVHYRAVANSAVTKYKRLFNAARAFLNSYDRIVNSEYISALEKAGIRELPPPPADLRQALYDAERFNEN